MSDDESMARDLEMDLGMWSRFRRALEKLGHQPDQAADAILLFRVLLVAARAGGGVVKPTGEQWGSRAFFILEQCLDIGSNDLLAPFKHAMGTGEAGVQIVYMDGTPVFEILYE